MQNEKNTWDFFRHGDESSFRLIFDHFYDQLYNYGHKFTTDNFLIEEALQDLFVKLWKNKNNLGETGSVKNYLYKAFRRVLLRKLDYKPRIHLFSSVEENVPFTIELGHEDSLIHHEHVYEMRQKLEKALASLSPRQREIIHLKYYEELEYEEIAAVMQLSLSSTYKLLYRAVDALKGWFTLTEWIGIMYLLAIKK